MKKIFSKCLTNISTSAILITSKERKEKDNEEDDYGDPGGGAVSGGFGS